MTHVIQNPDINVGPANYKTLAGDQLLVTSIFFTIQGEGPYAGHPAVFVRLAGCNRGRKTDMGCAFCDTAFQFANGRTMTFADIALQMAACRVAGNALVVITGGEPMMQNNLAAFCHYLQKYRGWKTIQIESNGDRLVEGLPDDVVLVVSPKVSKAADGFGYREPNKAVFDRANFFKFVVEDASSPYRYPPSWADTCGRPVYVSPLTQYARPVEPGELASAWNYRLIDCAATRANYAHAAALAMRYGYLVSTQTHLFYGVP